MFLQSFLTLCTKRSAIKLTKFNAWLKTVIGLSLLVGAVDVCFGDTYPAVAAKDAAQVAAQAAQAAQAAVQAAQAAAQAAANAAAVKQAADAAALKGAVNAVGIRFTIVPVLDSSKTNVTSFSIQYTDPTTGNAVSLSSKNGDIPTALTTSIISSLNQSLKNTSSMSILLSLSEDLLSFANPSGTAASASGANNLSASTVIQNIVTVTY